MENIIYCGVGHVVFVINETKHQLIKYFKNGHQFGCNISYVVQAKDVEKAGNSSSPGLAQALNSAYHLIKDKTVFFGLPDTVFVPPTAFCTAFADMQKNDDVVLCLFRTDRSEKFGMVRLSKQSEVLEIIDKPYKTDLKWMWGGIIWKPRFTEFLNEYVTGKQVADFAYILNEAISDGIKFKGVKFEEGAFLDLGTYEDLICLNEWQEQNRLD